MELRHTQEEPDAVTITLAQESAVDSAAENAEVLSSGEMEKLVDRTAARIRRTRDVLNYVAIALWLFDPALVLLFFTVHAIWGPDASLALTSVPFINVTVIILALFGPTLFAPALRKHAKTLDPTCRQLAESRGASLVGPLIDLLSIEDTAIRKSAVRALTVLLPTLTQQDTESITAGQRGRLLHYLGMNPEMYLYKDVQDLFKPARLVKEVNRRAINFRIAILQSYANIGGAQELSMVERLAANPLSTEAQMRLREAAQEVLDSVRRRAELERRHGVLLRPTESEDANHGTLLRPAEAAGDSDITKLLRPEESSMPH